MLRGEPKAFLRGGGGVLRSEPKVVLIGGVLRSELKSGFEKGGGGCA